MSIVTKFIRGNGRIEQIDDIMQPDHTFVIVRDLYETLASLFSTNWDYYRYGYSYYPLTSIIFFKEIISDAVRLNLVPTQYESYTKHPNKLDRISANAFCWYVMNKYILSVERENLHFIDYAKIEDLPDYLENLVPDYFNNNEKISDYKYQGDYIHTDLVLQSKSNKLSRYLNLLNEIPFYILSRATHHSPVITNRRTGEEVSVFPSANFELKSKNIPSQKIEIVPSDLLDSMNEEIKNLLEVRLERQEKNTSVKK